MILKQIQGTELSACDKAASFLQSGFWGAFKARFGWEALAFKAEWEGKRNEKLEIGKEKSGDDSFSHFSLLISHFLVLRRSLVAGFSLAYIPWGPELPSEFPANDEARAAVLKELALALKALLPSDTAFIRFDPPWYSEGKDTPPPHIPPPFIRSGADIQPPDTILIDLNQSMDELMAQMKPKWRYNARLALKRGVTLRQAGANETGVFYDLLKETARRDGIAIHSIDYYSTLLENNWCSCTKPVTKLYLAEHEGDVLAGLVALFRDREAVYLYGASSDKKRGLMAPYALQLKAMEDAKALGCGEYDLFGIPPNEDPSHPMAGLYRFKTGFGGRIIHRPGSWDYPCRTLIYHLFRCAEALRKNLRTVKKSILRRSSGSQRSEQ